MKTRRRYKETIEKAYNKIAEKYYSAFSGKSNIPKALKQFGKFLKPNSKILDAGCGGGIASKILSKKYELIGVDISEKMLAIARKNSPNIKFIKKDITKLNFPASTFDGICSFFVLLHLKERDIKRLIKSFYKLLKNKGVLIISTGTKKSDKYGPFLGEKIYWGGMEKDKLINLIKDEGFRIISSKTLDYSYKKIKEKQLFIVAQKRTK